MRGSNRSLVRVCTAALILALGTLALPMNQAHAYVTNQGIFVGPTTMQEGDVYTGTLAYFTDVGSSYGSDGRTCPATDTYTIAVSWGDSITEYGSAFLNGSDSTGQCQYAVRTAGTHKYLEEGFYNVSVSINSKGSSTDTGATATSVNGQNHVVDAPLTANPLTSTLTLAEGAANTSVNLGTFTDASPFCDQGDYTVSINWGDGNTTTGQVSAAGPACTFNVLGAHTYLEEGSYSVTATVTDKFQQAVLNDQATVADSPLSLITGSTINTTESVATGRVFLGTFSDSDPGCQNFDYTKTVSIDWNDGTGADTATGRIVPSTQAFGPCQFDVYSTGHTYAEEGSYAPTVTVADAGGSTLPIPFTVVVADAPLGTVANQNFKSVEGAQFTQYLGTIHDTDVACAVTDYTTAPGSVSVNWGDGNTDTLPGAGAGNISVVPSTQNPGACNFDVLGTHTYTEESSAEDPAHPAGGHQITVTATDQGGSFTTINDLSQTSDAALTTVSTATTINGTEGSPLVDPNRYLGTFNDAASSGNCDIADYHAVINWGDGTPTTTVTSTPGSAGSIAFNGAPSGCNFDVFGDHTYTEEGPYTITVTVYDQQYTTTVINDNAVVSIIDAPLTNPTPTTQADQVEGKKFTTLLGTFHDTAGAGNCRPADFTATIDWGNSETPHITTSTSANSLITPLGDPANCDFNVYGTYTYPEQSQPAYTISVDVKDDGVATNALAEVTWTTDVNVQDAVLTNPNKQNFNGIEGVALVTPGEPAANAKSQYLGTIIDADPNCSASDYQIAVNWGDGTAVDGTLNPADGSVGGTGVSVVASGTGTVGFPSLHNVTTCAFDIYAQHTYAEEGNYTVNVQVTDTVTGPNNDASVSWTDSATIADNSLTVTAQPNFVTNEGITDTNQYLGTFVDGDPACSAADYSVNSISWGDGTAADTTTGTIVASTHSATPCAFDVYGTHTYAEESEPGHPYPVVVKLQDVGGSTATLTENAEVDDSALTGNPGSTGNCTLLTSCTQQVASFHDTSTTCTAEGETTAVHYTAVINWGDGSTPSAGTIGIDAGTCNYTVTGSHVYTTPYPANGGNFVVSTTITDEGYGDGVGTLGTVTTTGASATTISVGVPPNTVPSGAASHDIATYSYPPGQPAPTYTLALNVYHYKNGALPNVAHIHFYEKNQSLSIPYCASSNTQKGQCSATVLSLVCTGTNAGPKTATVWIKYTYYTNTGPTGVPVVRYVKVITGDADPGTADSFNVTMSSAVNAANAAFSSPPSVPYGDVSIAC